jgi:hypothetical protein
MHPRLVFVDLPKDRRPEVYRFRPPRGEAKGGGGAFHLLGKSKFCSRKNAHRRCGILRRSKPSSTSVKVDCPKLVTDLGRPRFDVMETEVTHGSATPLMLQAPRSLEPSKERANFVITQDGKGHKPNRGGCHTTADRALHGQLMSERGQPWPGPRGARRSVPGVVSLTP